MALGQTVKFRKNLVQPVDQIQRADAGRQGGKVNDVSK
jgi:hypothetical protein